MRRASTPSRKLDRIYTYADTKGWPGDERWEPIEGTAWNMSPAPSMRHQAIVATPARIVGSWAGGAACGVLPTPLTCPSDRPRQPEDESTTVVHPDVSVICDRSKLREWGCYGARDWVVDPSDRFVHLYRLGADRRYGDPLLVTGAAQVESQVCPGLAISLDLLFAVS